MHFSYFATSIQPVSITNLSGSLSLQYHIMFLDLVSEYSPFPLLLHQVKTKGSKPKKKVPAQKYLSKSDVDDDDALKQVSFNECYYKYSFPLPSVGRVAV